MTHILHTRKVYKPNDKPTYINTSSNHPPSIIKDLPKTYRSASTIYHLARIYLMQLHLTTITPYLLVVTPSRYITKNRLASTNRVNDEKETSSG